MLLSRRQAWGGARSLCTNASYSCFSKALETLIKNPPPRAEFLLADGTFLNTQLCRSSKGVETANQLVYVLSSLRDAAQADAVVVGFDSGKRKAPVKGSAEQRRQKLQGPGASGEWWRQRGRPGTLAGLLEEKGFATLIADESEECDDVLCSLAVALHERNHVRSCRPCAYNPAVGAASSSQPAQGVLLVSGDADFAHAIREAAPAPTQPGAAAAAAGGIAWLRLAQFASVRHAAAEVWTWESFSAAWGFPPSHWADYLALVGRPRSGVAGLSGVGERAARSLVSRYGSLEALFSVVAHGAQLRGWRPEVLAALTASGALERALAEREALLPRLALEDPVRQAALHIAAEEIVLVARSCARLSSSAAVGNAG